MLENNPKYINKYKSIPITSLSMLITEDCNLACKYCLTGDSKILMSDLTYKDIKDVIVGDEIMGFDEYNLNNNKARNIYPVNVTKIFKRKAKTITIDFDDGNKLNITDGHPILQKWGGSSKYSWRQAGKYKQGQYVKSFPNIKSSVDIDNINYKIGYVVSCFLGDGSYKKYIDKNNYDMIKIRFAVKDDEIIDRVESYCKDLDIFLYRSNFLISKKEQLIKNGLFSNKKSVYEKLIKLIDNNFMINKDHNYYRGFLAGIYDCEGNISKTNIIRICNSNKDILNEIINGLDLLGVGYVKEKISNYINHQCYNIRIKNIINGKRLFNGIKFILNINPACYRKGIINFYSTNLFTNSKIINISYSEDINDVYNLETESNTYFANNIAVHNCYEKDKHTKTKMDKHVARRAIDFLIENTKKENADKNINLMLFGGEPTLNPTIISFVFEYVYKKQNEHKDINFFVSMITNCTNLPNEVYNAIDEYKDKIKLSIQLSIDGIERVQNMNRITKSGGDSFTMVEKNVWKYKKLFKDNPDALSIHGVLSPASLPYLFESYKFFREEWNFSRIWFIPACDEKMWPKGISEEYDLVMEAIYNYILNIVKKENNINEVYNYAPLDRCLRNMPGFSKPCGAGVNYASVTTHGDLYPCHQIYFLDDKDETYIGNIFDGVDDDKRRLFLEYSPEDLACPNDCDHYNCYRCIASNWEVNGSILSQIRGEYCEMMKIDQKYQKMLQEEVEKMGLLKSENIVGRANCECDMRECGDCLCNVDNRKQSKCGCESESETNTNEINYALMEGMKLLLEKVDKIEKELEGKNETGNIRCTCYERM